MLESDGMTAELLKRINFL